jgi:hypothetical protein
MKEVFEIARVVLGAIAFIVSGYLFMWLIAIWGAWYYGF